MSNLSAISMTVLSLEGGHDSSIQISISADRACERLMSQLSRLVGVGGSGSLIARSLVLTRTTVPWLTSDGSGGAESPWLGLRAALVSRSTARAAEAFADWFDIVFEILVRFIGPALAMIVRHDSWPDVFPSPSAEPT